MLVKDILKRENNNFDILRLIAASAVIVGHSRAITGDQSSQDLVLSILHFDYSGSLAVKFFFLLSGLVVTNSLIGNPDLIRFVISRIFRIFPALLMILLFSAYIMGPLVTNEPVNAYLADSATANYVYSNVILNVQYQLPGVFANAPNSSVNGSIWTIPMEFFCYLLLAIIGAVGLSRNRVIFSLVVVLLGTSVLIDPTMLDAVRLPSNSNQMMVFFAIGALLAAWKDKVSLGLDAVIAMLLAAYIFRYTSALPYIACVAIFGAAIWVSAQPIVRSFKLPGDYSYGIYLYGWPVQQLVHAAFPQMSAIGNYAISLPLAIGCGALSWYMIEKPAMQLGQRINKGLVQDRLINSNSI